MLLELDDGAVAEALSLTKNLLEVVGERAYAPGRPAVVRMVLAGTQAELRAKSLGSKRRPDGRFATRLRLVDLRREQRALLQQALQAPEDERP
jgi:hypothetical protein